MNNSRTLVVIGGDNRQYYMVKRLAEYGYDVAAYGAVYENLISDITCLRTVQEVWDRLEKSGISVVFPVPVTTDGLTVKGTEGSIRLDDICPHMREKEKLYGGNIPIKMRTDCEMKQGRCLDFMKSDRVALLNAVATAEGAITEASILGKEQLTASRCLVIGYGRCGEILADKLTGLGARVTVMARSERARARAKAYGMETCPIELDSAMLRCFTYVFNTVPAMIVNEDFLKKSDPDVTIIDIASAPGGVDFDYAGRRNIQAKICPGLPGKYAPKTAGNILAEEIRADMEKRNV